MKHVNTEMLGSLQTKIMDIIWKTENPLKPAEVLEQLGEGYAYTTVMTILKRLSERKILKRKMEGKVYLYSPVSCRKVFVETNLKDIFGDLVNSYGKTAIANFVDVVKNNKEDMTLLKKYLESHK
ncbi:MAG: BlaI/MecI/CopY family transcriptional regulator [Candidatus Shapirobacteria bacterium]